MNGFGMTKDITFLFLLFIYLFIYFLITCLPFDTITCIVDECCV